jgi:hypothetical protein
MYTTTYGCRFASVPLEPVVETDVATVTPVVTVLVLTWSGLGMI